MRKVLFCLFDWCKNTAFSLVLPTLWTKSDRKGYTCKEKLQQSAPNASACNGSDQKKRIWQQSPKKGQPANSVSICTP